ncbi:MAG: hypothetical protein M1821_003616 [Bathelium mastoideum]|nr:MAG: hypothetical protein M1821_003616 [Bathelium mastoideum]KAI9684904.1 MAG: hypothetical protein M1822_005553 [Bathelium mastoideum]
MWRSKLDKVLGRESSQRVVRNGGEERVIEADQSPEVGPSGGAEPATTAHNTATSTKPGTTSNGIPTSPEPNRPKQLPPKPVTPAAGDNSMTDRASGESSSSTSAKPSQDSAPPAKRYDFFNGDLDPRRYPASGGWMRWNKLPDVDGPRSISRGSATVGASYWYTESGENDKLPNGFIFPLKYLQAVAEALNSSIDENINKPINGNKSEPIILKLRPDHSLVMPGKQWEWYIESFKGVAPQVVWAFAQQQIGRAGLRFLFEDYILCMTKVKMPNGKCDASCVLIDFAKYPLGDAKEESTEVRSADLKAIDSFPDLPKKEQLLRITLRLSVRGRSGSRFGRLLS